MHKTIAIVCIIIAGMLLANYVKGGKITGMNELSDKKTYACKNEVKAIYIQGITGEIIVQKGNVDRVTVHYFERENDPVYTVSEAEGELSVVQRKRFRLLNIDFFKYLLTITVPGDLEGELEIHNQSGRIQLADLSGASVFVDNTTGNIILDRVCSKSDLTVHNVTGSVSLTDVQADGDIDVKNTTGKIQVSRLEGNGDIHLKTITGSITGTISGKESDYNISTNVVTGSNSLQNSNRGGRKLNASTTTGSIQLSFTE